jgi:hypothetical protein
MNNPLVVIPYACDNPGYPGLKLSEKVESMPNHDTYSDFVRTTQKRIRNV